jgi:hypothetical protein
MRRATRVTAVVLLVAGGVGYADWVLQLVLPVRADLMNSFVSELSASDQPFHEVFRAADLVGAVLLVLGAAAAWLAVRRHALTWALLVLMGACILAETALPLVGTFTFGAHLPHPGTHSWWHRITEPHGAASLAETVAFLALVVRCTVQLRLAGVPTTRRRWLAAVGITALLLGALDAALTASLLLSGHAVGLGLVQRTGVTLTAIWLSLAPPALLTAPHGPSARPREDDADQWPPMTASGEHPQVRRG